MFANPWFLTAGYSNPASVHAICDGDTTLVRYRTVGGPGFGLDNEQLERELMAKGCRELWDVMPGRVPNSGHEWMEKDRWVWLQYCVSVKDLRRAGANTNRLHSRRAWDQSGAYCLFIGNGSSVFPRTVDTWSVDSWSG